jgi:hypothetical protein
MCSACWGVWRHGAHLQQQCCCICAAATCRMVLGPRQRTVGSCKGGRRGSGGANWDTLWELPQSHSGASLAVWHHAAGMSGGTAMQAWDLRRAFFSLPLYYIVPCRTAGALLCRWITLVWTLLPCAPPHVLQSHPSAPYVQRGRSSQWAQ